MADILTVDLEDGSVSVRQQLTRVRVEGRDVWGFRTPKTKAGRRRLDLDSATVAALRAQRAAQAKQRLARSDYADADLVFARADGHHLDPDWITASFEALIGRSAQKRIRLHDLRHTHATLMLTSGAPVHLVAARLGHASPMVTLSVYAHVIPAAQREAVARFAAVLDGNPAAL